MFNMFIRSHLLTKKFFTFFIGSTFLTSKIRSRDPAFKLAKFYEKPPIQDLSTIIESNSLEGTEDAINYTPKKIAWFFKSNESLLFLYKNMNLTLNNLFYLLNLIKGDNILYCDIPKINKPYLGCSIRSNDDQAGGMKIVMIKSDSPAERAKLKVKDIILSIDGKAINTINDYHAAIGSEANKKKLQILRKEGDNQIIIEIIVDFIYIE